MDDTLMLMGTLQNILATKKSRCRSNIGLTFQENEQDKTLVYVLGT